MDKDKQVMWFIIFTKVSMTLTKKKKKKTTDMKIKVKQKDMENKQGGLALIQ